MRILAVSDLHLEFHRDGGASFISEMSDVEADALVMAGDVTSITMLPVILRALSSEFPHVIYVYGNHEFYGSDRKTVVRIVREVELSTPNLHVLDCDVMTIGGVKFVGTPLWFSRSVAPKHALNDFHQIRNYESWVYDENRRAIEFLSRETGPGCVVITHHVPTTKSIAPEHRGSVLNPFFTCDVEDVIHSGGPRLWIHGHTHTSFDYVLGRTRVVCNPLGYPGENESFDIRKVIDTDEWDTGTLGGGATR